MELSFTWVVIGLVAIAHFFLAMLTTSEVTDYPIFTLRQKILWQLLLWFLPILGVLLVHKKLGLGWDGGSVTGGDSTASGESGGGDCGGCGDGGC